LKQKETSFNHKIETVHVLIKCDSGAEKTIVEKLRTIPEIKHICLTVGNYDILIKIEADSREDLRRIIIWKINKIKNINSVTTLFCIRRPLCAITE
jgi:DNA-binding Lrp family transcriptional regulator